MTTIPSYEYRPAPLGTSTGWQQQQQPPPPPPPGFGRYAWWAPIVALAAGLAALALPAWALEQTDPPFAATLGEGLFLAALAAAAYLVLRGRGGRPTAAELGLRPTPARAAVGWVWVARITYGIAALIYVKQVGGVHSNVPVAPTGGQIGTLDSIDLVIAAVVLAPLGEELFFRGFMYASLRGSMG